MAHAHTPSHPPRRQLEPCERIDRHRVDFDANVQALAQTAKDMNSKYKETSEAGLALSVVLC